MAIVDKKYQCTKYNRIEREASALVTLVVFSGSELFLVSRPIGRARGRVNHVSVLLNAVLGLEGLAVLSRLVALGAPSKEVTANLNVVVGELAVLVIVHTQELGLLGSAELEARDEVDCLSNESRDDKGICAGGDNGSDLPAHDNVVSVKETANERAVHTVEANDLVGGEEAVEDEADNATDVMLSEDVEGIVDADEELDC